MKIYISFVLILYSILNYGQDNQLFDYTWYLEKMILEGEDHIPPQNEELPHISLTFQLIEDEYVFISTACGAFGGIIEFSEDAFLFLDFGGTLEGCEDPENDDYDNLYSEYFYSQNSTDLFSYSVATNANGSKKLIITNSDGNQAIYGNEQLSTEEFSQNEIIVFPNPIRDKLYIKNSQNEDIVIEIMDTHGKLLFHQKMNSNETEIDFSHYIKGIYFVTIATKNKKVETKKLIKN